MAERTICTSLARQLTLRSIERVVEETDPQRPIRRISLEPPLISSRGKLFDLTNDEIYALIDATG